MTEINALVRYQQLKRMNFKDFNIWIHTFYKAARQDGWDEAQEAFDAEVQKYSEDEMKALLGSVRGISDRLADEAVQKMFGVEA